MIRQLFLSVCDWIDSWSGWSVLGAIGGIAAALFFLELAIRLNAKSLDADEIERRRKFWRDKIRNNALKDEGWR